MRICLVLCFALAANLSAAESPSLLLICPRRLPATDFARSEIRSVVKSGGGLYAEGTLSDLGKGPQPVRVVFGVSSEESKHLARELGVEPSK